MRSRGRLGGDKQQRAARIREDRARHIAEEQLLAGTRADPHYQQVVISGAHRTQDGFPGILAHADFARDAEAIVLAQLDDLADGRARGLAGREHAPEALVPGQSTRPRGGEVQGGERAARGLRERDGDLGAVARERVPVTGTRIRRGVSLGCRCAPRAMATANGPAKSWALRVIAGSNLSALAAGSRPMMSSP